ncbi:hypothetical protein [Polyangium sp. 6x1]|uniref:hypothetical protein n=1 Tax=Polyangium sp. 6x1 TaxID=3042689 RepID=UPI00248247ED|nr:hypothetical protein [Polyangium sp. 6x1]MDI1442722.1 hypothetical protein [Polyangium sp. 6x1]
MRSRATTWMCGIVATLGAVVLAMGCSGGSEDDYGPCPKDSGQDVDCFWEGGISFAPDKVSQADGFIFVHGEMTWSPCGMIPGRQIRSYRIDPKDGSTTRMDAPANAAPFVVPPKGVFEVRPTGSPNRVRIDPAAIISVTQSKLPIGEIVDDATNEVIAPIELAAVCDE